MDTQERIRLAFEAKAAALQAIRSKIPNPCAKDCPKCGGQGHYHGAYNGNVPTIETCPGPDTPMFTMGEMRAVFWELDAVRQERDEANRQLQAALDAQKHQQA